MTGEGIEALTIPKADVADFPFRRVMDGLPAAAYLTDAQGCLTYFNSSAVRLFGSTPEIGRCWRFAGRILSADGTPLPYDQYPMALALQGHDLPAGREYIAERADGTRFWFVYLSSVLRDTNASIDGVMSVLIDITDRKASEIEASEPFRTIVETTPECVKIVAPDGKLLFMNRSGLGMLGSPCAEAVIGKSVYEVIAPEHRERFREFNQSVCAGAEKTLEFEIVGFDGERHHMETYAAPLQHTDGTTVQLAVAHDVTERKRAERTALLLSAIVDSSDDAIISKDLNGVIMSWNASAQRLFGYTAEEAIGRTVASLLIPEDRQDEEPDILSRLRRGERVDHFETVRRRKDGSLLDISLTISPVKSEGVVIGASKIARDITESKRIRLALMESEARFRQLADTMPQMVWTARPDGEVDYFNERWYDFTGFSRASTEMQRWESLLHPDDLERTLQAWSAARDSGEPYNTEYRFFDRRENRWRWFVARAAPVHDSSGKLVKWFGTCTDIDQQKRVEDELRQANEDLKQFAFSASHDLQEPLRGIKIYSELLERRYASQLDGDALKFLRFVCTGATRMEALVRDLLIYTQATKIDIPIGVVDAGDVLKTALGNLTRIIAQSNAQIRVASLPAVSISEVHLQQLFQNLVENAIKYRSPARAPIVHIEAERQGAYWIFSVADNGIGIDPEYKENIFGLFKRLHSSDEYPGTGIGLAICQRILDRYHGRIWFESEAGGGSTFRFTLPC